MGVILTAMVSLVRFLDWPRAGGSGKLRSFYDERSRQQAGDPVKLAETMLRLTNKEKPPLHFRQGRLAVDELESELSAMAKK